MIVTDFASLCGPKTPNTLDTYRRRKIMLTFGIMEDYEQIYKIYYYINKIYVYRERRLIFNEQKWLSRTLRRIDNENFISV